MIKNEMSVSEVTSIVEQFTKDYVEFEKRCYTEKSELKKVLPSISNKTVLAVLEKEIKSIEQEESKFHSNHTKIIQQLVDYVFKNDFRKGLVVVEEFFDTASYRNSSGGYDDIFYFVLSGQLGKPLYDVMVLDSCFEFFGTGKKIPSEQKLTNTMTHKKFVTVVNKFYIAEGEQLN